MHFSHQCFYVSHFASCTEQCGGTHWLIEDLNSIQWLSVDVSVKNETSTSNTFHSEKVFNDRKDGMMNDANDMKVCIITLNNATKHKTDSLVKRNCGHNFLHDNGTVPSRQCNVLKTFSHPFNT